jgi:hypothetical protein
MCTPGLFPTACSVDPLAVAAPEEPHRDGGALGEEAPVVPVSEAAVAVETCTGPQFEPVGGSESIRDAGSLELADPLDSVREVAVALETGTGPQIGCADP